MKLIKSSTYNNLVNENKALIEEVALLKSRFNIEYDGLSVHQLCYVRKNIVLECKALDAHINRECGLIKK